MEANSGTRRQVLSTLTAQDDLLWNQYVRCVAGIREVGLRRWLRIFWRESRGRDVVILRGTVSRADYYCDFLAAILMKFRRQKPLILISDATIEPGSRALSERLPALSARLTHLLSLLLIRVADGSHVRWCVLSTAELELFPKVWHVSADRVVFVPFFHTLWAGDESLPVGDGGFILAGGNSLRDYERLAAALLGCSADVRIASSWRPAVPLSNATVAAVSHDEFYAMLRTCHALVLPLISSTRSSGQQTYLNAMALGKPVIVTDAPGVRDYIDPGVTGVIVGEDGPAALRRAIEHVIDPANAAIYADMGSRAQHCVIENFTDSIYRRRLLQIAGVLPPPSPDSAKATSWEH